MKEGKALRRTRVAGVILALLLLLSGCSGGAAGEKTGGDAGRERYTVGFGMTELIAPGDDIGEYYIAGYRNDNRASGVLDWQTARAVFIDDNSGRGSIVIVSVDCVGLSSFDVGRMKENMAKLCEEAGVRSVHILSTHDHAGIDTLGLWGPVAESGRDERFMRVVYDGVYGAVETALASRKDGDIYLGSIEVDDSVFHDSRYPEIYSRRLTVIRFEPSDGSAGVRIANFGAHAEALRSKNSLVSADFPCYMGRRIKEASGDEFMFLPGAVGGLIYTNTIRSGGTEIVPEENVVATGELLADYALAIDKEQKLGVSLDIAVEEIEIPVENTTFTVMAFLGVLPTRFVSGNSVRTQVSYLELGGGALKALMIPGELFPELAWGGEKIYAASPQNDNPDTLSQLAGDDGLLIFGICDDEIGYIIPPDDFLVDDKLPYLSEATDSAGRSHYEETNSLGPDTANYIAEAARAAINRVRSE